MQESNANNLSPDFEETQELRNQHRQEAGQHGSSKPKERRKVETEDPCFVLGYN